jgi:hypothetical protein
MTFKSINALLRAKDAPRRSPDFSTGVTLRYAFPDDAEAVRRLAVTDSRAVPAGPLLLAEVGGELWAAVSLTDHRETIADPFRPTGELVLMLRERARRLAGVAPPPAARDPERRLALQTG